MAELRFPLTDPDDLKTVPSTKWAAEGLFPLGEIIFVCGAPKHLKTIMVTSCCCAMAAPLDNNGNPRLWFGRKVRRLKVAYAIGEGSDAFFGRVKAWQKLHGVPNFGGYFRIIRRMVNLVDEYRQSLNALMADLDAQNFRPEVLVIDTLNRTMPGANEDTQSLSLAFARLAAIQEKWPGITIIILHHTKKNELVFRGGQVIAANSDGLMYVDRPDMTVMKASVTCEWFRNAANFDPFGITCALVPVQTDEGEQGFPVLESIGDTEARTEAKEDHKAKRRAVDDAEIEMFRVMKVVGRSTYNELQRATHEQLKRSHGPKKGLGNNTFSDAIKQAKRKGWLVEVAGMYQVVDWKPKDGPPEQATPTPDSSPLKGGGVPGVRSDAPGVTPGAVRSGSIKEGSSSELVESSPESCPPKTTTENGNEEIDVADARRRITEMRFQAQDAVQKKKA